MNEWIINDYNPICPVNPKSLIAASDECGAHIENLAGKFEWKFVYKYKVLEQPEISEPTFEDFVNWFEGLLKKTESKGDLATFMLRAMFESFRKEWNDGRK